MVTRVISVDDEDNDPPDEVDLYDVILEKRAEQYLTKLTETERVMFCPAVIEDDRISFWREVKRIQNRLNIDKDSARELLNFLLDS